MRRRSGFPTRLLLLTSESVWPRPDENFPVGQFEAPADDPASDPTSVAIIAVAEVDERVVVAVPFAAWHRTVLRRVLPSGALLKPLPLTVELAVRAAVEEEGVAPHFETAKIWIGQLAPAAETYVHFDPLWAAEAPPDIQFSSSDPALLPTIAGLEIIFQQHFAFVSAASGASVGGGSGRSAGQAAATVDARLQSLESSISEIAKTLQQLSLASVGGQGTSSAAAASCGHPPGLPPPPKIAAPTSKSPSFAAPHVDASVVQSARQAGVPEHQIQEMIKLAAKGRNKLQDFPMTSYQPKKNALSETEDEEEANVVASGSPADPVGEALSKLTQIASHLTLEKKKSKTLEALLDGVGLGGSADALPSSGTRKYSAALRALRRAVEKQPEEIYKAVERNMEEDFGKAVQISGSSKVAVTARAWLELRSRVQSFQTPVRFLWAISGVLDALRADRIAEARARCCLILAMGDQMAIDRGSWIVAGEVALEDPPPMAAFSTHTLPSEAEPPYTRLIDGRWLDLFLAKLADVDNLNEKKKKLSWKKPPPAGDVELPKPGPKKQPKGGKGDKGGGKGAGADRPPAAEADRQ